MIRPAIASVALLAALTGCGGGSRPVAAPLVGDPPTSVAVAPLASPPPPAGVVAATPVPGRLAAVPTPTPRVVMVEVPAPTPIPTPTPKPAKPVATPKPTATPIPPHNHPAPSGPDGTTCPAGYHYASAGTFGPGADGQPGASFPAFCATGTGGTNGGAGTQCSEQGASGTDIFHKEEVCQDGHWRYPATPTP